MSHCHHEFCEVTLIHPESVERVLRKLPPEDDIAGVAGLFAVFSDPSRLKVLMALSSEPLCVCDLAAVTGLSRSAVSHQLRLLRQSALVSFKRDGKMVFYSLADDHVSGLIQLAREHWEE